MAKTLKPWPARVRPLCRQLHHHQYKIGVILSLCQDEGIQQHNYSLIEVLLPHLDKHTRLLLIHARNISDCLPENRTGRYPKWFTITLDIIALGGNLEQIIKLLPKYCNQNRWLNVSALLSHALQQNQRIRNHLESLPCTDAATVPDPFKDFIEEL